MRHNAPAAQP